MLKMSKGEHGEHAFLGEEAVDCFSLGTMPVWVIVAAFRADLATLGYGPYQYLRYTGHIAIQ
jgi:hypothetical protein